MNPIIMNLAIDRALHLVGFPQIVLRRRGEAVEKELPGEQVEDSLGGYTVPALVIPVTVRDSSVTIDPLADDPTVPIPEVDGEVIVMLDAAAKPLLRYSAQQLAAKSADYRALNS